MAPNANPTPTLTLPSPTLPIASFFDDTANIVHYHTNLGARNGKLSPKERSDLVSAELRRQTIAMLHEYSPGGECRIAVNDRKIMKQFKFLDRMLILMYLRSSGARPCNMQGLIEVYKESCRAFRRKVRQQFGKSASTSSDEDSDGEEEARTEADHEEENEEDK